MVLFTSGPSAEEGVSCGGRSAALGPEVAVGRSLTEELREAVRLWRLGRKLGTDRRDRCNKERERLVVKVRVGAGAAVSPVVAVGPVQGSKLGD